MTGLSATLWMPFDDYGFMRRALAGCVAMSIGACPLGVILLWRRMSLAGDAMSHAILPGAALGYFLFGLSLPAMTAGGFAAGLLVAIGAGAVSRLTAQGEDASFATFYLLSLGLGVLLISLRGSNVDLLHVLFGSVLALDDPTLLLTAGIATLSAFGLAIVYRPLVVECFDPKFLAAAGREGMPAHAAFLTLLVLHLVGAFHSLGTLMAVAFLVLPAAAARFWVRAPGGQMLLAAALGIAGGVLGLLASFHLDAPASAAITLSMGAFYLASLLAGREGGLLTNLRRGSDTLRPRMPIRSENDEQVE